MMFFFKKKVIEIINMFNDVQCEKIETTDFLRKLGVKCQDF